MKHIVAMLFLFAHLADLATGRSLRVRRRVLETLYPAEVLARRLVAGSLLDLVAAPPQMGPFEPIFVPNGGHPIDAASLALRLRALAFALAHLVMLAELLMRNTDNGRDDAFAVMQSLGEVSLRRSQVLNSLAVLVALCVAAIRGPPQQIR